MEKKKMFYGWWIVIALTVNLALLGPAAVSVANLFQTSVTEEFGIANSTFAINNLIVLGSGIFFSPALSNILNGKHYKKVLMVGTITYALGLIGYGFAQNITMFYFLSLLVGFGYIATTLMPTSIFINNWFIEKRGLALSIAISGLGIGGFLLSPILTPLISVVPAAATAPALIIVGILMVSSFSDINWSDFSIAVPSFFASIFMGLSYSIANGIAAGFITYGLVKTVKGEAKEVHPILWISMGLFILNYIVMAAL